MNGGLIRYLRVWAVPVWLGLTLGAFPALAVQEDTPEAEKGVDVLATGPIHEAFAETVAFDPEPGIFVSKAPPDPINEILPEHIWPDEPPNHADNGYFFPLGDLRLKIRSL